jgi:hypothetical protein
MAVVVARPDPPSVTASFSRSIAVRSSPGIPCRALAGDAEVADRGREPIFEIGVETVLRLTGLQVEETEQQRAGETEQRGRERNPHAAERRGEPLLERFEGRAGVAADLEPFEHPANRGHGIDQAPERAEQAEEDEQAGHVARQVARLVEPGRDRIQDAAHDLGRDGHAPDAVAEDGRHRGQQDRWPLDRQPRVGEPEAVHPIDLRKQPNRLPEGERNADQHHADDEGVQGGIGHERDHDLLVEHDQDERA